MRFVFLCVLLINIIFFIWEYRKGAPEIYLPPRYENNLGADKYVQKILLLSEVPDLQNIDDVRTHKPAMPMNKIDHETLEIETKLQGIVNHSTIKKKTGNGNVTENDLIESSVKIKVLSNKESTKDDQISIPLPIKSGARNNLVKQIVANSVIKNNIKVGDSKATTDEQSTNTPLGIGPDSGFSDNTCYQLKKGEYTQNTFSKKIQDPSYKLDLYEQQQLDDNSYLVLTLAANTLQEAVSSEQDLKHQGITDLWLFREGLFKWRISLGLFSGIEHADKAKEKFLEQINQVLEVVPSYLMKTVPVVNINTDDQQGIRDFEQKFSMIIDQKIACKQDIQKQGVQSGS